MASTSPTPATHDTSTNTQDTRESGRTQGGSGSEGGGGAHVIPACRTRHCTVINAPSPYTPPSTSPHRPAVFLAGTTTDPLDGWRRSVIDSFAPHAITILNPFQPAWDNTWRDDISDPRFREQVTWELEMMEKADVIAVWLGPESGAPISMLEVGLAAGRGAGSRLVVACPESEWRRRGNLQVLGEWAKKRSGGKEEGIVLVDTLEALVKEVERKLGFRWDHFNS